MAMSETESMERDALIADILRGFNLTPKVAAELADAMRRGGPMEQPLHLEFFVKPPRVSPRYETVVAELAASLQRQQVPERWVWLLPQTLRPEVKYLYYVLRDGETYGRWTVSNETHY
jgi:hypothetical protein